VNKVVFIFCLDFYLVIGTFNEVRSVKQIKGEKPKINNVYRFFFLFKSTV